ncbi:sugar transferase [Spirosoma rigui]|uniref:sugar transferase n=1 Tax=Spirosoma rigui TaxID=564064 RepID=UPI0009B11FE3|nr:sugar transferase [Spirosoma rigui]
MQAFSNPETVGAYKALDQETAYAAHTNEVTFNLVKKRLFDISVSLLVSITLLIWLIPLFGLLIKLTSRGPIIYVQTRSGRRGKTFNCLKFRTMSYDVNAEFRQATSNDKRITRVGRFLRRTNLDELPQFLNVLVGHMSVVGPRPHPLPLDSKYWVAIPGYKDRYTVKPGITGLAQARGARGETDELYKMVHRVRYDHLYIRRKSLRLDAMICWWTVQSAMRGNKGAW